MTKSMCLRQSFCGPTQHPLLIGKTVSVYRTTHDGDAYLEGKAVIRARGFSSHHYIVMFKGEKLPRERFVHPALQGDTKLALDLIDILLNGALHGPFFSDFTPIRTRRKRK